MNSHPRVDSGRVLQSTEGAAERCHANDVEQAAVRLCRYLNRAAGIYSKQMIIKVPSASVNGLTAIASVLHSRQNTSANLRLNNSVVQLGVFEESVALLIANDIELNLHELIGCLTGGFCVAPAGGNGLRCID